MYLFLRPLLMAAAVAGLSAPALAQHIPPPSQRLVTLNEAQLRDLDNEQLRFLRRALRGCRGSVLFIRPKKDPCVITWTDRAIAQEGDEALQDFHWALPLNDRYDEFRPTTVWRVWLLRP